jgi:hypothetical protein
MRAHACALLARAPPTSCNNLIRAAPWWSARGVRLAMEDRVRKNQVVDVVARLGRRLARGSTAPLRSGVLEPEEQERARDSAVALARELASRDGLGLVDAEHRVLHEWDALAARYQRGSQEQLAICRLFGSIVSPALAQLRQRARTRLIRLGFTRLTEIWYGPAAASAREHLTAVLLDELSVDVTGTASHPIVLEVLRNVFWPLLNDVFPERNGPSE